jgi:hypothetical protein
LFATHQHPALPSPADALGVESVNIRDLEIDPSFATLVYPSLVAGNTADATLTVSTPTARGDATFAGFATVQRQFKYAWQPIAGTPFRICVALALQDRAPKPLLSPPWYDNIALPGAGNCAGTADACDVYHDIAQGPLCGKATDGARKGTVRGTAGAFYAASAFDKPSAWLEHRESAADAKAIAGATTCNRAGATPPPPPPFISKSVGSLKNAAINDNMVARQVGVSCVLSHTSTNLRLTPYLFPYHSSTCYGALLRAAGGRLLGERAGRAEPVRVVVLRRRQRAVSHHAGARRQEALRGGEAPVVPGRRG